MGDKFVSKFWPTVITTKNKAHSQGSRLPYLFDRFNVIPLFPPSSSIASNAVVRMFNQLIEGLNENLWLPKYLVFLPDHDLIETARHFSFGCKIVFNTILTWLGNQIESTIQTRKDDLCGKRAGALNEEVRIIWVKMVPRPFIHQMDKSFVFAQCNTFNSILQSVMGKYSNTEIISLYFPEDPNLFDGTSTLSANGRTLFWRELNRFIRGKEQAETRKLQEAMHLLQDKECKDNKRAVQAAHQRPKHHTQRHRRFNAALENLSLENAYHTFNRR